MDRLASDPAQVHTGDDCYIWAGVCVLFEHREPGSRVARVVLGPLSNSREAQHREGYQTSQAKYKGTWHILIKSPGDIYGYQHKLVGSKWLMYLDCIPEQPATKPDYPHGRLPGKGRDLSELLWFPTRPSRGSWTSRKAGSLGARRPRCKDGSSLKWAPPQ